MTTKDHFADAIGREFHRGDDDGKCEHTVYDMEHMYPDMGYTALKALEDEGGKAILMNDGTLVPLDGSEPVEGVVVLKPMEARDLREGTEAYMPGWVYMPMPEEGPYIDATRTPMPDEVAYVPINTTSEES